MRLKTESTVALLHDPKAINRAVEFLIEHFEEIFTSAKKGRTTGVDASETRLSSKSRQLQKKIKMVLRRPFNQMNQDASLGGPTSQQSSSAFSPQTPQVIEQPLYASLLLTDDERERFREPPPWNPPDLPTKEGSPSAVVSSKPSSPRHLAVNLTGQLGCLSLCACRRFFSNSHCLFR